ncbi:capsid assembly scaffolding protein Gp46 family protein [Enterococcus songbeiensis]
MKLLMPMKLQFFAESDGEQQPAFSFDDFKSFAESNEDAQKFLQSQSQSAADKQLESWKQNNLDKIKQDTIKQYEDSKKNKSPEQQQLEKLQAEFEAEKALRVTSDNKAFVAEQIAGLNFEGDTKEVVSQFMLNNLVTGDTKFTQSAVEGFTGVLAKMQENHQEEIKSLQMDKAYGNQQQSNDNGKQNEQPKDPNALLAQMMQNFN